MPKIEISEELASRLADVARERGCSVEEVVATMLESSDEPVPNHPLVAYVRSPEFRVKFSDADRFLALLGWVAKEFETEFSDFVLHLSSRRRYLGMSAEEIRATCSRNQARQIPGSRYWAIMNLDTPTKRRFLRRLLVFVGLADDVIGYVTQRLGPRTSARSISG